MSKTISIILAFSVSLFMLSFAAPVNAVTETQGNSTITNALAEKMVETADDVLIPVTIELSQKLDLDYVDARAIAETGYTLAQLENYETAAYSLTSSKNEIYQQHLIKEFDKIAAARNAILVEYYQKLNQDFLVSAGLEDAQYHSLGLSIPFIRGIELTKEQIHQLAKNNEVCYLDYFENETATNCAAVSDTMAIIGGNVAVNNGYRGSGIKVGIVENGNPNTSIMGTDAANIHNVEVAGQTSVAKIEHATLVSGIIKQFAPDCSIYARTALSNAEIVQDCESLIINQTVHVINVSCGVVNNGSYDSTSRQLDQLIENHKVAIVAAAGNSNEGGDDSDPLNYYVTSIGMSANAITVGSVTTSGTNPDATGAFTLWTGRYMEANGTVNKPDICAPGTVSLYGLSSYGTSFAAPHVTGTIVQMIARNAGLANKPEILKAALIASAYRNTGTSRDYVSGTLSSNQEGAGIIDSEFCYYVAQNGRRWHFDITNTTTQTVSVYCDSTSKLFRIGAAWHANSTDSTTSIIDIDIYVYKNGVFVGRSIATSSSSSRKNTNYEVIELSPEVLQQYGAGYYDVQIRVISSTVTPNPCRVGIAWEQPR